MRQATLGMYNFSRLGRRAHPQPSALPETSVRERGRRTDVHDGSREGLP